MQLLRSFDRRYGYVKNVLCKRFGNKAKRLCYNYVSRRSISKTEQRYTDMKGWCITEYGGNEILQLETIQRPTLTSETDVLVEVHASSVNPLDVQMRSGYGSNLLNMWRKLQGIREFPLILGRDFSGVVLNTGRLVRRFEPGNEVWGTPSVISGGCHAQYVVAKQDEISMRPSSLSHVEATSLPYVACTVWVGLVSRGGLGPESSKGKRVLVLGGSGGIGTFAIQLLKSWGAQVTTTCSTDAMELVTSLGADHVIDYRTVDVLTELKNIGSFDVILDAFGGDNEQVSSKLLSRWSGAVYVNLTPPLLPKTDQLGVGLGVIASGRSLLSSSVRKATCKGASITWGFFSPNPGALDHVTSLINEGKVKPVIQAVFPFSQTPVAYAHLEAGHARGKTVIQVLDGETRL